MRACGFPSPSCSTMWDHLFGEWKKSGLCAVAAAVSNGDNPVVVSIKRSRLERQKKWETVFPDISDPVTTR